MPNSRSLAAATLALTFAVGGCSSAPDVSDAIVAPSPSSSASSSQPGSSSPSTSTAPSTPTTERAISTTTPDRVPPLAEPVLGVERLVASDFAALDGQRVGLITNQVSMVDGRHLIDWLADAPNVELVTIFAAEHGVRGVAGAGEPIGDGVDTATGTPIRSLYGATRQPTPDMLSDLDTIVFDLQDVGARYYTYTATMGLAMQAAAAANVRFVVLDRPNPLGRIVDGDLRTDDQISFISQFPTPSLHGLTAGELARMMVGEAWLPGLGDLELEIVEIEGWSGEPWAQTTVPWIPPSPGLQTVESASTYPATVWFEATTLSYGAGTELAFQAVGAPWLEAEAVVADLARRGLPGVRFEVVELTPVVLPDIATDPRFDGETLPGVRIVVTDPVAFRPSAAGVHMVDAVIRASPGRTVIDRGAVFDLLAGTADVRRALLAGTPAADIVADWPDVAAEFEARTLPYRTSATDGADGAGG